jgi:hypothetical protein
MAVKVILMLAFFSRNRPIIYADVLIFPASGEVGKLRNAK